jgi:uncharacterized RDD family membrane protein YckC
MQNHSKENVGDGYAGFFVRLAAYAIDMIIVTVGLLAVRLVFVGVNSLIEGSFLDGGILFHYTLKDIVLYLFQVVYFILFTYHTGTTLGKKVMNLQVVSADGETKLNLLSVIYRETIGRFLCGCILCVGYLMIGVDKEKRGLHDILCDTRVIYSKKVKVYPEYVPHRGVELADKESQFEKTQINGQEDIQSQWDRILNPQREEAMPHIEKQNIEGNS